jgi:hypothetical protein
VLPASEVPPEPVQVAVRPTRKEPTAVEEETPEELNEKANAGLPTALVATKPDIAKTAAARNEPQPTEEEEPVRATVTGELEAASPPQALDPKAPPPQDIN